MSEMTGALPRPGGAHGIQQQQLQPLICATEEGNPETTQWVLPDTGF